MLDVLVTGCDQITPLSVIRSLGRRGIKVLAAGARSRSIGFYSRYATRTWVYPSQFKDKRGFIQSIIQAVQQHQINLIFPASESTLVVLDEFRSEIERHTRLAAPSSEAIECAIDKVRTYDLAEKIGIPVPKTVCVHSVPEAVRAAQEIGCPGVRKRRGDSPLKKPGTYTVLDDGHTPSE